MSVLKTGRKKLGPAGAKRQQQRRNKKVPNMGKRMAVEGIVTNEATSLDGAEYVTIRTKPGTGRRYNRLKDIFAGVDAGEANEKMAKRYTGKRAPKEK